VATTLLATLCGGTGDARAWVAQMTKSSWTMHGRRLPALDGVRAFAILGVIAYHLGFGWASGGYLGVDLFFVLSGFLITSLLVEEHQGDGRIALGGFWGRRARRLLPALFLVLVAVSLYALLNDQLATNAGDASIDLSGLRGDGLATLFYVANWHAIFAHQSYFAQFASPSPLQHTWSLAIEEQFYLVWPLVVAAVFRFSRGNWRRTGLALAVAGSLASAVAMGLLYHGGDPSRVYYGSDTRAFDILIGAALAMLCVDRQQTEGRVGRVLHALGPVAAVALAVFWWQAGTSTGEPKGWMFEGGFFVCAVLAAVVLADVRRLRPGPLARVLSLSPLTWIGQISYGLYLWHWPVIVYMTSARTGVSGHALQGAQVATTFAVSTASYYLVELPVRQRRLSRLAMRAFAPAATLVTVGALVAGTTPSLAAPVTAWRGGGLAPGGGPTVPGAGGLAGEKPIALPPAETIGPGNPLHVMILGDSVMDFAQRGLLPALQSTQDVVVEPFAEPGWGLTQPGALNTVLALIAKLRPQLVIGMWSWDDATAKASPTSYRRFLDSALTRLLAEPGLSGVVLLQLPAFGPAATQSPGIEASARGVDAWNGAVADAARVFPGRVMYWPVAGALEIGNRYTTWLPALGTSATSLSHWVRVRPTDEVHMCPPGITRFAASVLADMTTVFHLSPPQRRWWVSGDVTSKGFSHSGVILCPDDHPASWSALPRGALARINT
jgi:peptidoglycan/LPS O-acetylase OafA/YrhL